MKLGGQRLQLGNENEDIDDYDSVYGNYNMTSLSDVSKWLVSTKGREESAFYRLKEQESKKQLNIPNESNEPSNTSTSTTSKKPRSSKPLKVVPFDKSNLKKTPLSPKNSRLTDSPKKKFTLTEPNDSNNNNKIRKSTDTELRPSRVRMTLMQDDLPDPEIVEQPIQTTKTNTNKTKNNKRESKVIEQPNIKLMTADDESSDDSDDDDDSSEVPPPPPPPIPPTIQEEDENIPQPPKPPTQPQSKSNNDTRGKCNYKNCDCKEFNPNKWKKHVCNCQHSINEHKKSNTNNKKTVK